jgi:hypothetical protein
MASKGVGSQGDGTIQVLCKGPTEQAQVLELLEKELGCAGFIITVPVSLPNPTRSLPLYHTHRVRCALLITDPFAYARYPFLSCAGPPCLLPIPYHHGTKPLLVHTLLELVACGVQRIAVFVPCARDPVVEVSGQNRSSITSLPTVYFVPSEF